MTTINTQCIWCAHLRLPPGEDGYTCEAFPEGVPKRILLNRVDHREPVEGDNNLQWRPREFGDKHPLVVVSDPLGRHFDVVITDDITNE